MAEQRSRIEPGEYWILLVGKTFVRSMTDDADVLYAQSFGEQTVGTVETPSRFELFLFQFKTDEFFGIVLTLSQMSREFQAARFYFFDQGLAQETHLTAKSLTL